MLLGALCLLHPDMRLLLLDALSGFLTNPNRYLSIGAVLLLGLVAYAWTIDRRFDAHALGWILYLLLVSVWEEWVFRLALPYFAIGHGANFWLAVIAANVLFGAVHYFTLRWRWQWCLATALGGLAFSRQIHLHFDLALVIGIHWVATFLNTPRLPGRRKRVPPVGERKV